MKNWKSLFIKTEEEEKTGKEKEATSADNFSFPTSGSADKSNTPSGTTNRSLEIGQTVLNEVVSVYEKGIDSINMPGYDFYEFYKAISTVSGASEQAYQMAFQMARSMDSNLTPQKLLSDAEFYISKINEVHNQYTTQGQQKLNTLDAKKNEEKNRLTVEIDQATRDVNNLRNQLQTLEAEINQKRLKLSTIDNNYFPQENSVREKLMANDHARQLSISKLLMVKDGIQKHIK
jgi:hypothetical protein